MEKHLDTTKPRYSEHICQSLGPSIYRASTVSRFKASEMNIVFDVFKAFCTFEWRHTKFRSLLRKQNNLDQGAGMAQRRRRSPSIVARFDSGPMSYVGCEASHRGSFSRFSGFPLSSRSTRTEDPPYENQLRLIQCGF